MAIEWALWDKKLLEWEKDLMFNKQFNENENGPSEETNIRATVELTIGNPNNMMNKRETLI